MTGSEKTILVIGATGRQGGAVARKLLEAGWKVRALTRNPINQAAQTLARAGADLVAGNMNDRDSLEQAMLGAYGVFSVQQTVGSPGTAPNFSTNDEITQGKVVADVAKAVGIQHFVFSSVGGAERQTGIRNFEAKWAIEQHVRALGLPATVLRPVSFMENYVDNTYGIKNDTLSTPIAPNVLAQLIAVDDVGSFAAIVFKDAPGYLGRSLEIAGDALTPPQIADAVSRATGRTITYLQIPIEAIRKADPQTAIGAEWLNRSGYKADIPVLRKLLPTLKSFEAWLSEVGAAKFREMLSHQ